MSKGTRLSLDEAFSKLKFFSGRRPDSTAEEKQDAFAVLSEYRDGAVFVAHSAGYTEWERHANGDEIVFVIEGSTTLILLEDGEEKANLLKPGELLVVPQNTWHRFETPDGAKVMTVTPLPTEHSLEKPETS